MSEPVRELRLAADLLVYVSDMGCIVIEQTMGDQQAIVLEPMQVPELLSALRVLGESAAAKQAAVLSASDAEFRAAAGEQGS